MKKSILSLMALASLLGLAGAKANLGDTDVQLRERSTVEPAIDGQWRMWAGPKGSISQWISPESSKQTSHLNTGLMTLGHGTEACGRLKTGNTSLRTIGRMGVAI
jgi:hypothetical protein